MFFFFLFASRQEWKGRTNALQQVLKLGPRETEEPAVIQKQLLQQMVKGILLGVTLNDLMYPDTETWSALKCSPK